MRAVSAEALLPVAALLAGQGDEVIASLTSALWDILLEVDDLSPSTGALPLLARFFGRIMSKNLDLNCIKGTLNLF